MACGFSHIWGYSLNNVFNEALMNDAVYKFKRYEDSSLTYAGIDRHEGEQMVGGYSTVITMEEYLSS